MDYLHAEVNLQTCCSKFTIHYKALRQIYITLTLICVKSIFDYPTFRGLMKI